MIHFVTILKEISNQLNVMSCKLKDSKSHFIYEVK
jgi:hypothetical protein